MNNDNLQQFKLNFLGTQNQNLKKELNLIKTKIYAFCKEPNAVKRQQLMLEILTILDLPVED